MVTRRWKKRFANRQSIHRVPHLSNSAEMRLGRHPLLWLSQKLRVVLPPVAYAAVVVAKVLLVTFAVSAISIFGWKRLKQQSNACTEYITVLPVNRLNWSRVHYVLVSVYCYPERTLRVPVRYVLITRYSLAVGNT